jgi:pathogenicity locus Cdd1 protein
MSRKLSLMAKDVKPRAENSERELGDLVSVGPATVRALHSLGVRSVAQLARCNADSLYNKLCRLRGRREDPCCLDVFAAAVAQARDSELPVEKRVWWYWSQQRKASGEARRNGRG